MNLEEINNNLLRTIENADNTGQFLQEFLGGAAQNVTYDVIDANGHHVTRSVPNITKFTQSVSDALSSEMNKTIYVDAINGDDLNVGTEDSAKKSLSAALKSQIGGHVSIYLKAAQVHVLTSDIYESARVVDLERYGDGANPIFTAALYDSEPYQKVKAVFSDTSFYFTKVDVVTPKAVTGGFEPYGSMFWQRGGRSLNISCYKADVIVNDFPIHRQNSAAGGLSSIQLSLSRVVKKAEAFPFYAGYGLKYGNYSTSIEDAAGNALDHSDIVAGIVRDANGVPRNLISNKIL